MPVALVLGAHLEQLRPRFGFGELFGHNLPAVGPADGALLARAVDQRRAAAARVVADGAVLEANQLAKIESKALLAAELAALRV